jgi:transposase InsO family protein
VFPQGAVGLLGPNGAGKSTMLKALLGFLAPTTGRLEVLGMTVADRPLEVRPSMGSVGDAYDNAMAESFFATLECELLDRRKFQTKAEARMAVFQFIEGWYNPARRHSALGYQSPINYERSAQTRPESASP